MFMNNENKEGEFICIILFNVSLSKAQHNIDLLLVSRNAALQTIFAHLLQPADGHEELPPQEEIMKLASAYKTMI